MINLSVAIVSGLIAFLTAVATSATTYFAQRGRLRAELENALSAQRERLRAELDNTLSAQRERLRTELDNALVVQREKVKAELRTEFMAEEAVKQLLQHEDWPQRSFKEIGRRLGGFNPNELRRLLVRAGAVRFGEEGENEWWELRERNEDKLRKSEEDDK